MDENITDPYKVSLKTIIKYLENRKYKSTSHQNQIIGSLKLFAKYILGKKEVHLKNIERPRNESKLQPVIPRDLMLSILNNIDNLKHKSVLTIGYACGLRVSEIINLKWCDIDREQEIIFIRCSKGNKDRAVPINENIIKLLIEYYKKFKSKTYVFNGQDWRPQYSSSSCNALVKKYIGVNYRFHSLRKSCATHLYDFGNDLAKIQDLLGHKHEKTTRIYVKESIKSIKNLTELV